MGGGTTSQALGTQRGVEQVKPGLSARQDRSPPPRVPQVHEGLVVILVAAVREVEARNAHSAVEEVDELAHLPPRKEAGVARRGQTCRHVRVEVLSGGDGVLRDAKSGYRRQKRRNRQGHASLRVTHRAAGRPKRADDVRLLGLELARRRVAHAPEVLRQRRVPARPGRQAGRFPYVFKEIDSRRSE